MERNACDRYAFEQTETFKDNEEAKRLKIGLLYLPDTVDLRGPKGK